LLKVTGYGLLGAALVLVLIAAIWLVGGWIVMLLLGALHHSVWAAVPALGYWPSVLVYIALSFVAGLFKNNGGNK
jgi:hypothetical protein